MYRTNVPNYQHNKDLCIVECYDADTPMPHARCEHDTWMSSNDVLVSWVGRVEVAADVGLY